MTAEDRRRDEPDWPDYRALEFERIDDVLRITIDHPSGPLSAVDDLLHGELTRLFRELRRESRARTCLQRGG